MQYNKWLQDTESFAVLFKLQCELSLCVFVSGQHESPHCPSVKKKRAEKALFVFAPVNRQNSSTVTMCVCVCKSE